MQVVVQPQAAQLAFLPADGVICRLTGLKTSISVHMTVHSMDTSMMKETVHVKDWIGTAHTSRVPKGAKTEWKEGRGAVSFLELPQPHVVETTTNLLTVSISKHTAPNKYHWVIPAHALVLHPDLV